MKEAQDMPIELEVDVSDLCDDRDDIQERD